ncbi:MAG: glycosyltransferase [Acidobacteriota bacterium]
MRVLWLATKSPWPAIDGGRLLLWETLAALAERGDGTIDVLAAVDRDAPDADPPSLDGITIQRVPVARPSMRRAWLASLRGRAPEARSAILQRHATPTLARAAADALRAAAASGAPYNVVQVEQVHALWPARVAIASAVASGAPRPSLVLRAQNVESDLWRGVAGLHRGPMRVLLRREARRLARAEGAAVRACDAVCALTPEDAGQLMRFGGPSARAVEVLPAPVRQPLQPASRTLAGDPALVVFGSRGWRPNRDGVDWLLDAIWPPLASALPGARLHWIGGDGDDERTSTPAHTDRITRHPAPLDSRDAFAPGSVHIVPLRVASGVRMKILEAWSRGVAVVATPAAARGLYGLAHGDGAPPVRLASDAAGFVAMCDALRDPSTCAAQIASARVVLRRNHAPTRVAGQLVTLWEGLRSS